MPDPIANLIAPYLPRWLSPQAASGRAGLLIGFLIGALLNQLGIWFTHRRERIKSDDAFRKLAAKKWNEHLKLYGSMSNTWEPQSLAPPSSFPMSRTIAGRRVKRYGGC